jgi:hypothetical protein
MGDDIRFTLLKPGIFNYPDFMAFSYSADLFYNPSGNNDFSTLKDSADVNIQLWRKRCRYVPSYKDTYEAVYVLADLGTKSARQNSFIRCLYDSNDKEAIEYLVFAKKCGPYNSVIEDPWERKEHANVPQRGKLMHRALELAGSAADKDIQMRYAFLAIRLAYYNDDPDMIKTTYSQYFASRKSKNIVDYWSMYFLAFTEKDSVRRNFYASQVFSFAPDKRVRIFPFYNKSIPVGKTLDYAGSPDEKIAVWMLAGFRTTGRNLEVLKTLYSLKPDLPALSFLLLREVNKLEDWIYTPYYTSFSPSLESWGYWDKSYPADRIQKDRIYAKDILSFVSSADFRKVENPALWKNIKAYLYYMTEDYANAVNQINVLLAAGNDDPEIIRQLDIMKSLCLTAMQTGKPVIPDEIKPVLMKEFAEANNKFIFAIARELEYRGNTTDAAILLSKLRTRVDKDYSEGYWRNGIYWKTSSNHHTLFVNYYDDYFYYLDAQYNTSQLTDLIDNVRTNSGNKDPFTQWKYSVIRKDIPRLYDLLGTKYLRSDNLKEALTSFRKVNDSLWTSKFYAYSKYLDANPFYTNMFNEHGRTTADTVSFSKPEILNRLISYLDKGSDENEARRDYYYFLAANCYFNMTQYGNSWMMRRYFWTSARHKTKLEDDEEYFNCILARKYYLKAKEVSHNDRFAALCLRMAGRCEKYRILYNSRYRDQATKLADNRCYKDLRKEYPEYYEELMGNCQSFDSYFSSGN